jgi:uncharacterized protein (DUF58 family)
MLTPGRPGPVPLRWELSGHARRLITLALAGLVLAVITRRAEFAGVAAPAVLLLVARRPARPASISLDVRPTATRIVEGEQATIVAVAGGCGDHAVEMRLRPADSIAAGAVSQADGMRFSLPFRAEQWGRRPIGELDVTLTDRWRLMHGRVSIRLPQLDCYPRPARQDRLIVLSRLPSRLGEHPARALGEGAEFAGVREFVPGDRQRRINWPATTRLGSLQLNTFAAERVQNVVVVLDMTSDVGNPGSSSLDLAVRAAAGTARSYLAARDRVGVVLYGSQLSWISPGAGRRQFHRIMDLMLAGHGRLGRATELGRLPKAALPPGALIMVFSPLLSAVLVETLRDLRERGHAVLIVDVLNAEPGRGAGGVAGLAQRIWRMEQQAIRFSLRELGIPVVHWDGQRSLDEPLAPYTRRVMVTR